MRALCAVRSLKLSDWLIGAGFVRNLIWDHQFGTHTRLNDIDVVYYCAKNTHPETDYDLEVQLLQLEPTLPWSVTNQARMHSKNGDPPYHDTMDALSYWPEKQTAIGVMLDDRDHVVLKHCFDLDLQFNETICPNPKRGMAVFEKRLSSKDWLTRWPTLRVEI